MTDINQTNGASELGPCDQDIFRFARQLGMTGVVLLLSGGIGTIASSGQTTWDAARSMYLIMVVLGPVGIIIAQRIVRILMKHRRKNLNLFF